MKLDRLLASAARQAFQTAGSLVRPCVLSGAKNKTYNFATGRYEASETIELQAQCIPYNAENSDKPGRLPDLTVVVLWPDAGPVLDNTYTVTLEGRTYHIETLEFHQVIYVLGLRGPL